MTKFLGYDEVLLTYNNEYLNNLINNLNEYYDEFK